MDIEVYTQPACTACVNVKRWLTTRGVPFAEAPITDELRDRAKAAGVMAAPIIVQGDRLEGGFNVFALEEMVEKQKAGLV